MAVDRSQTAPPIETPNFPSIEDVELWQEEELERMHGRGLAERVSAIISR